MVKSPKSTNCGAGIWHKVHTTACVEIPYGTVGEFVTNYLRNNQRRNQIIGELSINGSAQFIVMSEIWGCVLPYIPNLLSHVEATGWVSSSNDTNQIWRGSFTDPTSMTNVIWGVLITCHGVLLVNALADVDSSKIFFTKGVIIIYDIFKLGFSGRGKAETFPMVLQLCNVLLKIPLLVWVTVSGIFLVWVTVSGSLIRSPCASIAVALFD